MASLFYGRWQPLVAIPFIFASRTKPLAGLVCIYASILGYSGVDMRRKGKSASHRYI